MEVLNMNKVFIKLPNDKLEKLILSISLYESLSDKKITKQEIIDGIDSLGIELTPDIENKLKALYPNINLKNFQ